MTHGSAVSNVAARMGSTAFLAPLIVTSPCRGTPPLIKRLSMNRDSQTRMTNDKVRRNDQIRMTKPATAQLRAIGHSGFGFHWSLVIGHWSFNDLRKSGSWPQSMNP